MDIGAQVDKLYCALNMSRNLVGVKFIFSEEEFDNIGTEPMKGKASYCQMVKLAAMGRHIKSCRDNFTCGGGVRAIGLEEPDNSVISGQLYYNTLKLYNRLGTAKAVQKYVTFIEHRIYGVLLKPLQDCDIEPDIVIIILNPYQAMRVIQGYAYHYRAPKNIRMTGNQAICSECTAVPYETNDLNISCLCSGTRMLAGWDVNEMSIGIPFNMFNNIVDGVIKTINPTEPDSVKNEILLRCKEKGITLDIDVEPGKAYYRR